MFKLIISPCVAIIRYSVAIFKCQDWIIRNGYFNTCIFKYHKQTVLDNFVSLLLLNSGSCQTVWYYWILDFVNLLDIVLDLVNLFDIVDFWILSICWILLICWILYLLDAFNFKSDYRLTDWLTYLKVAKEDQRLIGSMVDRGDFEKQRSFGN